MPNKKLKAATPFGGNVLQVFRRTIHGNRSKNLRRGLSAARATVKPELFPMIVRDLSRTSLYGSLLAPMTFPRSISALTSKTKLVQISAEGELMWCASVLSLYVTELYAFVKQRDFYYKAYVNADYEQAERIINDIQETFGFSLWLLGNRLQLLQVTKGLQAQKNFLEEILSTNGIDTLIVWVMFLLSMRAEDNVSYTSFEQENKDVLEIESLRDYLLLHLLPLDFVSIVNHGSPIEIEESHPIIDRFETFVAMALSYCTKHGAENHRILVIALEQIEGIADPTILRMLKALRDGYQSKDTEVLQFADAYTEGRYQDVIDSACESLELIARAHSFSRRTPSPEKQPSLRQQIISQMHHVLSMSPEAQQSRQSLKKLALTCPDRSITLQVAAFLERTHDHVVASGSNELDLVKALCSALDNPWSTSALDRVNRGERQWLQQLLLAHPSSSSLKLRLALITRDVSTLLRSEILLPKYRQAMYVGHVYLQTGDFEAAAIHYLIGTQSDVDFISLSARRYLFEAYYANGQLYEAVQLAIDQILAHPSAGHSYPLEELSRKCLLQEKYRSSIDLAVLLHLATRHCNAKLERDLSNVYENVLEVEGVSRPSALVNQAEKYNLGRFVYFLRHVCVPRILDDTTHFESVDEIDAERIAVCQALLLLDPPNVASYQAEIRAITRDIEVANLLTKMQTSKIYVDESGIRESIEPALSDSLVRYQKLLSSPGLAFQADNLSKRLSKILSDQGHPEFKDLKLPATELEGLFHTMLLAACLEFSLNPAYGLDTHLSTSIRHGAFEGHLRSPLAVEELLCLKNGKDYILPTTWRPKLAGLENESFEVLCKQLARFTQRFEEIVQEYLKEKLHVRQAGSNIGLFNFYSDPTETQILMDGITPNTDPNDLADRLIAHFWDLTTKSLDNIRADLRTVAAIQMSAAFDGLVRGVESKIPHASVTPLIDAIARSRTAFHIAIEDVANWFHRPTDLSRDPFDIEIAMHVALQQVGNCYVKNPIDPILDLSSAEKIDGKKLDGLCEILFILLQNVIRHSGLGEQRASVTLSTRRDGETLVLECKSPLASGVSLSERRACAEDAKNKYERDSALKMAREEGGSGLSKIWRIAEFDLRVRHEIELLVTDNRSFIATLSLAGVWV